MAPLYYLSFQRAPPRSVTCGQTIAVAPTIYNDLREDVYEPAVKGEADVHVVLAWLAEGEAGQARLVERAGAVVWSGAAQAFNPVQIAVPLRSALGRTTKQLRLAVYAEDGDGRVATPWTYGLASRAGARNDDDKTVFVPALSATIFIRHDDDDDDSRTNRMLRCFQLGSRDEAVPLSLIRMEEQAGYDLEGHLWDAALHLVRWLLSRQASASHTHTVDSVTELLFRSSSPLHILELGAGTGLVSIALAVALAQCNHSNAAGQRRRQVTISASDLPSAMELLQSNVRENRRLFAGRNVNLDARVLDWDDDGAGGAGTLYDMILIADCTYNPRYFPALCRAIQANLRCSGGGHCLLAKKHRHVDEDALWGELAQAGLKTQRIAGHDARLDVDSEHVYVGWGLYLIIKVAAE